jgi:hypothetical protein
LFSLSLKKKKKKKQSLENSANNLGTLSRHDWFLVFFVRKEHTFLDRSNRHLFLAHKLAQLVSTLFQHAASRHGAASPTNLVLFVFNISSSSPSSSSSYRSVFLGLFSCGGVWHRGHEIGQIVNLHLRPCAMHRRDFLFGLSPKCARTRIAIKVCLMARHVLPQRSILQSSPNLCKPSQ